MKSLLSIITVMCSAAAMAAELRVEYTEGWSPDFTLNIDFDTGALTYLQKKEGGAFKEFHHREKLTNFKNIGRYVKGLMQRIPEDKPGGEFGDDTPVYKFTWVGDASMKPLIIGSISAPGAIHLKEGLSAEKELADAQRFKDSIDSYLLCQLIDSLARDIQAKSPK